MSSATDPRSERVADTGAGRGAGELARLRAELVHCMGRDRLRIRRRLKRLRRPLRAADLERVEKAIAASRAEREARAVRAPRPEVAADLPIAAHAERIAGLIAEHPVVIVAGETGSGKTTQLPKICLRAGRGLDGLIGHTQPRRVAARSVAARIAEEMGSRVGETVGCKVRFSDESHRDGFVKLMTDGILLAEVHRDRGLEAYDTIIVDEAHERSLNIDFLLGYLQSLLRRRRDLRVVISSATLDVERFSAFFAGAPVVEVSGRTYPIEVRHAPPEGDVQPAEAVAEAVAGLCGEGRGDVLVFLSGEREIRETAGAVRRRLGAAVDILPLYARLPLGQQARLFAPSARRRIVLSTNVAETSLTVPGVRYVVDSGLARISRFSHRSSVQRLPVEPVSRASAAQRAGRCGRLGPGVCVRLYSVEDHDGRPEHTAAEIARTDLASVVLRLKALGIDDPAAFPFIEAPDRRHLNDGLRLLREIGALDEGDHLTAIGERLSRLAVDPRIGRILVAADALDSLADVLVIVSALAIPDPRERPEGAAPAASAAHARFRNDRSDFLTLLNLWDFYQQQARNRSGSEIQRLCRRHFLSAARMREWRDVHDQLRAQCAEIGLHRGRRGASYGKVHRALMAGLWRLVGSRTEEREYRGVRGGTFRLSRASGQYEPRPRWIVAAEIVETRHAFAHCVASVRPEWIEAAAGAQLRRTHFEAYWDARRAEVMALEQTAVYDVVLTPRRRVRYAPVSREGAREIFIRSALVDGELGARAAALIENAARRDALRDEEARLRRPGAIVAEEALYEFYDAVLPSDVCDARGFEAWRRRAERSDRDCLRVDPAALRRPGAPRCDRGNYPDRAMLGGVEAPLRYRFAPGEPDDGVTATVNRAALASTRAAELDWAVPGHVPEKVEALLRSLPKEIRRRITPIASHAEGFLATERGADVTLADALGHYLRAATGVRIEREAWQPGRVPEYLRVHLQVVDDAGKVIARGDDLPALQRRIAPVAGPRPASRAHAPERFGLREWTFGDLPLAEGLARDGVTVMVHPALVDQEDSVALCRLSSPALAAFEHPRGVRRLFVLGARRELAALRRELPQAERLGLLYALVPEAPRWVRLDEPGTGSWSELAGQILLHGAYRATGDAAGEVRTPEAFEAMRTQALAALGPASRAVAALVLSVLEAYRHLRELRAQPGLSAPASSLADIDRHLAALLGRGFAARTPPEQLAHLPRYLAAATRRLEKLAAGGARDAERVAAVDDYWSRFERRASEHAERGLTDPGLERFRWMLEEYRVSLFAQELGTDGPVSAKRLDRLWRQVEQ